MSSVMHAQKLTLSCSYEAADLILVLTGCLQQLYVIRNLRSAEGLGEPFVYQL